MQTGTIVVYLTQEQRECKKQNNKIKNKRKYW